MYTQCPHCHTTFQVTRQDLQRARGTARCGECGELFDAIEGLSPAPREEAAEPVENDTETAAGRDDDSVDASEPATVPEAPASEAEQLAADPEEACANEVSPERPSEEESASVDSTDMTPDKLQFDDETPLEEILASIGADPAISDISEYEATSPGLEPEDWAGTADVGEEDEVPESPIDGLDDTGDWRALLAELDFDEADHSDAGRDESHNETGQEPTADTWETDATDAEAEQSASFSEAEMPEAPALTEPGDEGSVAAGRRDKDEVELPRGNGGAAFDLSGAFYDDLVQSGVFRSLLGPDADRPGAPDEPKQESKTTQERETQDRETQDADLPGFVSSPIASDRPDTEDDTFAVTGLLPRPTPRARLVLWGGAVIVLVLALAAQVIHGQRAHLATLPDFGPKLQGLYRLLGADLEPYWDIGALCVESSSGDASADALEISSVIVHRGDRPQPFPLLHVALTDRWQSVIGSRTIAAADYLPAGELRDVKLRPGDRISAMARLADPGSEAAGYELHVCYAEVGNGLRCTGACP